MKKGLYESIYIQEKPCNPIENPLLAVLTAKSGLYSPLLFKISLYLLISL